MAMRGTPIPAATIRLLRRLVAANAPVRAAAREAGVSVQTARKYLGRPPAPPAGGKPA